MPSEVSKPQNPTSEITWEPTTSIFLELLGKGWYSVNVDFRKKETSSISVGLQYAEGIWPSFIYYRFFGEKHRLETGGGVSGIINNVGIAGMTINGVVGYRYQKKKGLIFRIGFAPFYAIPFTDEGRFMFVPWAGISLGYSF
ncbi:MAG TPA: hypothetical protein VMV47_08840 [Bacteroidales bacterium]|nr:hypothetical protein [Bacteroidales bacterium]